MSILNSKFNVLRGWAIGGDASIDLAKPAGTGLTFTPGMFGMLHTDGTIILPPAPSATAKPLVLVVNGNSAAEFDTNFVGKILCLIGQFVIKTDVYLSAGLVVGGGLGVNASGQLVAVAGNLRVGYVLEDNTVADGTITAVISI